MNDDLKPGYVFGRDRESLWADEFAAKFTPERLARADRMNAARAAALATGKTQSEADRIAGHTD